MVGTLGILLLGKQRGLIPALATLVDLLRSELGFFICEELRRLILRRAAE